MTRLFDDFKNDRDRLWALKRFAKGENPHAQYELSQMFFEGRDGVGLHPEKGLQYLEQAAENGHAEAQNQMGLKFHTGTPLVEQDYIKAKKWFVAAEKNGSACGANNLGKYYEKGLGKLEADKEKAFNLYADAYDRGADWPIRDNILKLAVNLAAEIEFEENRQRLEGTFNSSAQGDSDPLRKEKVLLEKIRTFFDKFAAPAPAQKLD